MKKDTRFNFKFSKLFLLTALISTTAHATVFQKPIIVDDAYIKQNGNVIVGNFEGNIKQPAITINTTQSVIITNSVLQGPGDLIQALTVPANITVTNTTGTGTNPNVRGVQKGIFLHVFSFTNINMQNNNINNTRLGFFCKAYAGNNTASNSILIERNLFTNMDARPSDGKGSYETTGQYNGQAIHLGNVFSVPGIDIGWNEIINTAQQSSTGSLIEINESSGTAASPMLIHDNFISGAFPTYPGKDLFDFGGILVNGTPEDNASTTSSFITISANYVVATANYGIALVAGHDILIENNRVVSSGYLPDGVTFYPMSNYGDPAGAINENLFSLPSSIFFNNVVSNNVLGLIKNNGKNQPQRSDWQLSGQGGAVKGNTSFSPTDSTSPTLADEAQELVAWQQALSINHISVGTTSDAGYVSDGGELKPASPISTSTSTTLTLDHLNISNPAGDCIVVNASGTAQVTVTNSEIGPCNGRGIAVSGAASAVIENNYVHDVTAQGISVQVNTNQNVYRNTIENAGAGIYVANNNVNVTQATVDFNKITNVTGIAGANSSAIQFNQISGPFSSMSCNVYSQPTPPPSGLNGTGDSFNLFLSSGTAGSPIQVIGNRINGGGAIWNGGGILLTDGDMGPGTAGPGFVNASDNLVINPGGYGIDVSTGHDITINGNFVFGDDHNFYSNGTYGPGRIGINTFNVYSSNCANITVTGNLVYYLSNLTGSVDDIGLDIKACSPTNEAGNVSYTPADTVVIPAFDVPRPSCASLLQQHKKLG